MLPTTYQQYIHLSRYSRWSDELGRRETWEETVGRYFQFFVPYLTEHNELDIEPQEVEKLYTAIKDLKIMPSMRCLMTAGPALSRDHVAAYNCAYRPVNDIRAFDEIMFILMCATGVGFSVERQYVNQLPPVPETLDQSQNMIVVRDSKRGWAEAYRELLGLLYAGRIPRWDVSKIRPKGARLMTMGGRASGPEPLVELFEFTVRIFQQAVGSKLTSIQCHDLVCMIGECVVVGGVRRSALLSLSNLSDQRMRDAKSGEWWTLEPQRQLSNNSVCYTERPTVGQYMDEWKSLYDSKSGERGIFNREAARKQALASGRRLGEINGEPIDFGTNPCSEIILRPKQFCNLSTVVARNKDDFDILTDKVRLATILGTWQSCLTNFRYLSRKWKQNCEEERLLGVSITGIMDNPILNGRQQGNDILKQDISMLREVARDTNKEWSERLGIPAATAITCVKPEGTASQLVNTPPGIHGRYAEKYVRRVIQDNKDPLTEFMVASGFPNEPHISKPEHQTIFLFPHRAPNHGTSYVEGDLTAIEHLELWKIYQDHWCEHKPSITVQVKEHEWPGVGAWVWNHFDEMSGVAFLPHSDHVYRQAPYTRATEEELVKLESEMPIVDWNGLAEYEQDDFTIGNRELACTAGNCEI